MPVFALVVALLFNTKTDPPILAPFQLTHRATKKELKLTPIGDYGRWRESRPAIPGHFHTGVDLARPFPDSQSVFIYPVAAGRIISIRRKGPYSQVVIEHSLVSGRKWWSVYEHFIPGNNQVDERVTTDTSIGRLMNAVELNRNGWQFNHLHLEIMKVSPQLLKQSEQEPERLFLPYTLQCYTEDELQARYVDPMNVIGKNLVFNAE